MDSNFEEMKSSELNVMFKDLKEDEKEEMVTKLESITGVSSVDYENNEDYNKDNYTLYTINVDDYSSSETASNIYNNVKELKPTAMSGSIEEKNKPVLQLWIVILAITIAMIILIILSDSVAEPFLYLIAIGIAIAINKGTNIVFPNVSNITDSITAILQLALSMDYSIMLSNRYRQEREKEKNKVKAMKNALYDSLKAISSSSVTTIVGLLALVFMSFTIGRDLGFVLAKGVLLSLVSIFLCLPALLLLCENLILKTQKKALHLNLTKLGNYSYKTRYIQLIAIIVAFAGSFFLKGNLGILYTASEEDEVGKVFPAKNQIAIVYKNEYENLIASYCESIKDDNKVEQALCYSNTINQKLAYEELNNKFEELGQDTEIEEYLIKLIYYNYHNNDSNNTMTFEQFVSFIKSDIYTNESLNDNIDEDARDNIELLENFVTINNINKDRTVKEISEILGVSEHDAEQILIYYNSINNNTSKITLKQFVDFMYKDILTSPDYSSSIDESTRKSLDQLATFTDKNKIYKELTKEEMTTFINNVIGSNIMTNELMEQVYLYYTINGDNNVRLTLNQFANFSLLLSNNPTYSSQFNEETISSLKSLAKFSSNDVDKKMTSKEMANFLSEYGFNETITLAIYNYYLINETIDIPNETIDNFLELLNNEQVQEIIKDENTQNAINNANSIIKEINNNIKVDSETMSNSFIIKYIGIDKDTIKKIYETSGNDEMSIVEFITVATNSGLITNDQINNEINKINTIVDSTINNSNLTPEQISYILNMKKEIVEKVIEINEKNKEELLLTPNEFISFLLTENNEKILNATVSDKVDTLKLAKNIINNKNNTYNYNELSNYLYSLTGMNTSSFKTIYNVYYYQTNTIRINPYNLVNFLLDHKEDELLKSKLSKYTKELKLVDTIMESTINNKKYSSLTLSNELGLDKDKLDLIFSLYNHTYEKNHEKISLNNFITFTIENVMNKDEYSDKFDDESKNKLLTVKGIMNATINGTHYNAKELYSILNKLSDIDSNLIELVYMYRGSINNYNEDWKMTVEEFINYLYKDILKDTRFTDFINDETRDKVNNGYTSIKDARKLLVSDEYSRVVLNTKYASENEETFEFINSINEYIGDNEGIYIIGDSPMALEMSGSFGKELDFITILTMIFIFVVVAFTFKSVLIPIILVLIIQCAVYVTMAVISLMGGHVYFIALLIVQAILMGATIDYAIVYTSYYKESRLTMNVKNSVINAYNKSIHTILCSSSILILVTLVVANFASAIAAKICETISQGTIAAVLLIILVLPGVLAASDKIICRTGYFQEKKIK